MSFLHPDQPVEQNGIPETEFSTKSDHAGAPRRDGKLLSRTLPQLHERLRVTLELSACGGQGHAVAAAHEEALPEAFFQRANTGAYGRLGDVEAIGSLEKASGMNDLEERACAIDIHVGLPFEATFLH